MKNSASFTAAITKLGINPVVDPPEKVLLTIFEQAGKSSGPIPVRGKINDSEFIQTLVKYRGKWRLYINGEMLKASGLKVGDEAKIEVEFDPRPRVVPLPELFVTALKQNAEAKQAFEALSQSRQKEILQYLGFLKTKESLVRNVEKIIRQLEGKPIDKPHVTLRRN